MHQLSYTRYYKCWAVSCTTVALEYRIKNNNIIYVYFCGTGRIMQFKLVNDAKKKNNLGLVTHNIIYTVVGLVTEADSVYILLL